LLFKKKKKLKNRKKIENTTSKSKKIFENKKSFSRIFFLLYSAVRKKNAPRIADFPKKQNKRSFFCRSTQRNISV